MKVLMFGWEFPPHMSGGLGTACFGLTQGLVNQGVDVTFVLPKLWDDFTKSHVNLIGANRIRRKIGVREFERYSESLKFLEVWSPLRPYITELEYKKFCEINKHRVKEDMVDYMTTEFSGGYGPNLMEEIVRYSFVASVIAQNEIFDVIHAHDWITFPAGIEAKRASNKPLIIHVHATEFDRCGDNVNQKVYDIERSGMEYADLIITVSHFTKDQVIKHYGINNNKIRVVHNAVSQEKHLEKLKIKRNLNEKIVLFLGRITFQKGPDYFIEAARKVLKRMKNVRFVMAGTGDMLPKMVERVAALRIAENFHFIGFLGSTELEKIYGLSDLYVMPSVSEPFGITPLEAMVYDIPIIVSKQSGVAEILDFAVKVDFWDINKLSAKILEILQYPEIARKMVQEGSKRLQNIKWDISADKVINVYKELLKS
jgi:glycogen synthase